MGFFCDIMIIVLGLLFAVAKAELIPIEELNELMLPYINYLLYAMVVFLLLKYAVYVFRAIQDIRLEAAEGETGYRRYILLGSYTVCDLARIAIALGILSSIVNQLVQQYSMVNPVVDHLVLMVLVLITLAINYFCYDSETIRFNAITTAVIVLAVVFYSKGMFLQGLTHLL